MRSGRTHNPAKKGFSGVCSEEGTVVGVASANYAERPRQDWRRDDLRISFLGNICTSPLLAGRKSLVTCNPRVGIIIVSQTGSQA